MLHEYLPIVVAAGAGKEGVVAVIHVNKLLSGVQGEVCKGQKAQCERGQNKVVYALTQRNGLRVQNFSATQKILPLLRANRGRFFCIEALIDASCHKHIRRICANFLLQRQRDRQIDVFLADSVRG